VIEEAGGRGRDSGRRDPATPEPLPGDWLPEPYPSEVDPAWEGSLRRILAAAEPELARRAAGRPETSVPGWIELGRWWKPVAALAAAALALLFIAERPAPISGAVALTLIAAEGDPAILWSSGGVPADPVLSLLAFEDHEHFLSGESDRALPGGEPR